MDTITCPNCGKRNDPGDHICIHCAAALDMIGSTMLDQGAPRSSDPSLGQPFPETEIPPVPQMPSGAQSTSLPATAAPSNAMAVASLILGIVGLVLFWIPVVGFVLAILAMVFGGMGIARAKAGGGSKGLAVAGLTLGAIDVVLMILAVAAVITIGSHAIQQLSPSMAP